MVRRYWRQIYIFLTFASDLGAIILAGFIAIALHVEVFPGMEVAEGVRAELIALFSIFLLGLGLLYGLYRSAFHLTIRRQYLIAGKAFFHSTIISFALLYILNLTSETRKFSLLFFLMLPVAFLITRAVINNLHRFTQKKGFGKYASLILGYDDEALPIFERFKGLPELGYDIKGIVLENHGRVPAINSADLKNIPTFDQKNLADVLNEHRIERLFIPSPTFAGNGHKEIVRECKKQRVKIKVLSPESDHLLSIASIHDIAGITLYTPPRTRTDAIRKFLKRTFDFIGSAALLFILSPVFLITALLIMLEDGRPVFFKQKRAAIKGGREFYFHKFRSMVKNADALKDSLRDHNETDGALFKIKDDPRLTKIGKIIRKYSIDELPQLFNVLKGEMSLVGPRPLPVNDFESMEEDPDFWEAIADRDKLLPGMTGLWQVSGRSALKFREMVLLDLYYVEHHSILFDFEILIETVPVVLFGRGAF